MKKTLLSLTIVLSAFIAGAQKYEDIKNQLIFNKYREAKTELDKAWSNAKFTAKAEAFILKTAVYAGLAMDEATRTTPAANDLRNEAATAFAKYREMEPALTLMKDPIYQNGPINLYSSLYSAGYDDYNTKKWADAFDKLKKAEDLSALLISQKILNATLDTNVLILAGITAENSGNSADAAKYYDKLIEGKVGGKEYESIYRFMVNHYFVKKDFTNFEKYKALGAGLYPKSEFFQFDKIDFAVGLATNFTDKVKAVEDVLANDPDNYKANQVLGEIIYDTLNPRDENAVYPDNAVELEGKMIKAFTKAANAKPESENAYLYMGDHFINQAVRVNKSREAHVKEMQTRTKPGTKSSPEDVKKRDELDKLYGETLVKSQEPYEKAAAIFAARLASLTARDKQQYKKAASYLADVFAFKKIQAKSKPAELAKYTAEEKKWTDIWESIK